MIGLIFGDTDFPNKILKTIKKRKIRYLIIDLSKSKKFKKDTKSYLVSIGQFGKIINILSSYIMSKPKVGLSEYIANKSYLLSMSNSWASEFARHNRTSNSISPSFMNTNFTKNIDPRIIETIKNNNPLREILKTKDVAEAVEYFVNCSQQVNGQNLVINNNLD